MLSNQFTLFSNPSDKLSSFCANSPGNTTWFSSQDSYLISNGKVEYCSGKGSELISLLLAIVILDYELMPNNLFKFYELLL